MSLSRTNILFEKYIGSLFYFKLFFIIGYEANCEMYFRKGTELSYTYMIDPDGPPSRIVVDLGKYSRYQVANPPEIL
jgi:hypothetical protein